MARDFDGSTDRIDYSSVQAVSGQAMTFSCWLYLDAIAHSSYILNVHTDGTPDTFAVLCWLSWSSPNFRMAFTAVTDGTSLTRDTSTDPFALTAWIHLLYTWDGGLTATNIHIYIDGSEASYGTTTNGTGSFTAADGPWSLGGRNFDDARNLNGKMAACGWWNRVLGAGERAMMADAFSPLFIPNGLKSAPDLVRNQHDIISGQAGTLDGTTVFAHPRIIIPARTIISYPTAGVTIPLMYHHYQIAAGAA